MALYQSFGLKIDCSEAISAGNLESEERVPEPVQISAEEGMCMVLSARKDHSGIRSPDFAGRRTRLGSRLCALAATLSLNVLASAPLSVWAATPRPVVRTSDGPVAGATIRSGTVHVFRGIPFAASPVGRLRWKAPQPHSGWATLRDAKTRAPACLQNDYGWNRLDLENTSEDCLTLDVATPAGEHRRLPVMVWIHGGSNRAGSAGDTVQSSLTAQGVVLVALQYRLGIFGFLSHRALAAEQGKATGNYGLMDQIAALRWVQANIAQFGGDPANVTIFGESAGSQDVSLLLATPRTRGLFRRAIMQSGTPGFGMEPRNLNDAFAIGDQLDALVQETAGRHSLDRMRSLPAKALLATDLKLRDPEIWNQDYLWLRSTIDGHVLTRSPEQLLRRANRRAVIIGANRFEFGPAPGSIDIARHLQHWFGAQARRAEHLYAAENAFPQSVRLGPLEARIETDAVFRCPAANFANLLAGLGWPVWRYEFDIGPMDSNGQEELTAHGREIDFVMNRIPVIADEPALYLQDYWLDFARHGRPGGTGNRSWQRYLPGAQSTALFTRSGVSRGNAPRKEICDLISRI